MDSEETGQSAPRSTAVLFDAVYDRLKAMAGRQLMGQAPTVSLHTTVLVHDLYLRLCKDEGLRFEHDAQFFAYAARAMRHLLTDRARERARLKVGGDWQQVTMVDDDERVDVSSGEDALRLDAALTKLEREDPRAAEVVELRFFAGLSLEDIATAKNLTRRTIDRDWRFARAFLQHELG